MKIQKMKYSINAKIFTILYYWKKEKNIISASEYHIFDDIRKKYSDLDYKKLGKLPNYSLKIKNDVIEWYHKNLPSVKKIVKAVSVDNTELSNLDNVQSSGEQVLEDTLLQLEQQAETMKTFNENTSIRMRSFIEKQEQLLLDIELSMMIDHGILNKMNSIVNQLEVL